MITRLFRLQRDLAQSAHFDKVGEENLTTSVSTEPGTLAMYATHEPDDPATCWVFEVYADEAAYQVHAAAPHFKAYVAMAADVLTGREVISVEPQVMVEKPEPLRVTAPSNVEPHLVFVDVAPGGEETFRAAIETNMRTSVAEEPGVLVMYATTLADKPSRWAFWEVYASSEAYEAHRESAHFKAYLVATDELVAGKEFHVLATDTLASKGSLR